MQVKAFVTQVEQSAKKQLKSSKSQRESINPSSSKSKKHQQSLWADSDSAAPKSIKPMNIQPAQPSKVAPPSVTPSPTPPAPQPAPPPSSLSSSKPDKSQKEVIQSPKSMVLTLSKQANGSSSPPAHSTGSQLISAGSGPHSNGNGNHNNSSSSSESSLDRPPKPQFYFGQTMNEVVRKSSVPVNGNHQTAIDKVKKNEALSHPKKADQVNASANKVAVVTELNKKGRHTSIISVSDEPYSGNVVVEAKKISSQKAASQSSGVSSLSSSSSNSSGSTRSSPAKDASPSPPCSSQAKQQQVVPPAPLLQNKQSLKIKTPVEPTQDSIRKAFEAQLIAGKSRLKKTSIDDEGGVAKPPPASVPPPASIQRIFPVPVAAPEVGGVGVAVPPPPPPMPPSEVASFQRNGGVPPRSYEIPQAPKLKKTPPKMATKKGLVAPNGLSTRDELMNAIRGTGGFHGLRKVF